MIERLLAGVASVALLSAVTGAAWAQENTANLNTDSAITQDGTDAVFSRGNAAEDGAIATNNAIGEDTDQNAVAFGNSAAGVITSENDVEAAAFKNSTAVEEGAFLGGNGVAVGNQADDNAIVGGSGVALNSENEEIVDEGSAILIGEGNNAAAADQNSASANDRSIAIRAEDDGLDNGSSAVNGNGNTTASAEEGAAVGRDGIAVGVDDNDVNGEDATAAFGFDNVVAAAHLSETIPTGIITAVGTTTANVTTGNIQNQTVGALTGANAYVGNTGLANQGDAIGIAAQSSF